MERIKLLEKRIDVLEREKRILEDKLNNQARLLISLGKKVIKMDSEYKEDRKTAPVDTHIW